MPELTTEQSLKKQSLIERIADVDRRQGDLYSQRDDLTRAEYRVRAAQLSDEMELAQRALAKFKRANPEPTDQGPPPRTLYYAAFVDPVGNVLAVVNGTDELARQPAPAGFRWADLRSRQYSKIANAGVVAKDNSPRWRLDSQNEPVEN